MLDLLSFQFIQNAIFAAFLISIASGIIGTIIVSSKYVFLSGAVAHSSLGGIGVALYFGFSTMLGAAITSVAMSFILLYYTINKKENLDSLIATLWAFGMAFGIILIDITPGYGADLSSYLFGSILSVSRMDIAVFIIYDFILIIFISLFYREVLSVLYDEIYCKIRGIDINGFLLIIFILISLGIVISMSIAGLVLILAMLSIPAYISNMFVKSLKSMLLISSLLSFLFISSGFIMSYIYNLTIGACVVMSAVVFMMLAHLIKLITRNIHGAK